MANKVNIRLCDLSVILFNLMKAYKDRNIGHEDSARSYSKLKNSLSKAEPVLVDLLESALWSCTMLDESEKFEHPEGLNYDDFLIKLFSNTDYKLNKNYNYLEVKNGIKTRR